MSITFCDAAPGGLLPADHFNPPAEHPSGLARSAGALPGPFQVVLVQPEGYVHSAAFAEVFEAVACGLRALGADASEAVNQLVVTSLQPIVFGANLLGTADVAVLPPGTIVYNLEQIDESSSWCPPTYLRMLQSCEVWD